MTTQECRRVRIGLQLAQYGADYAAIRQAVVAAESLGVDAVFNWDHFFGPGQASTAEHFECWTMLGAWAESTAEVELGPLVSCTAYRNPHLVADMARTLDHLSNGRFILGLGAGFKERDFREYGYPFRGARERLSDFALALTLIRQRLGLMNPAPIRRVPCWWPANRSPSASRCGRPARAVRGALLRTPIRPRPASSVVGVAGRGQRIGRLTADGRRRSVPSTECCRYRYSAASEFSAR